MLTKVFKYDFKALSKQIIPLFIIMLSLGGASLGLSFLGEKIDEDMALLGGLFSSVIALSALAIAVLAVVSFVLIFYRYFKSVFTDEGYLTNVLPLAPHELFFGKVLVGALFATLTVVLTLVAYIVGFAVYPLVSLGIDVREIHELLDNFWRAFLFGETVFDRVTLITSFLFSAVEWLILIYTAITVGSLTFRRRKMLGSLAFVLVLSTAEEFVKGSLTLLSLVNPLLSGEGGGWMLFLTDSVLSLGISVALSFLSLHLFSKKFNIE